MKKRNYKAPQLPDYIYAMIESSGFRAMKKAGAGSLMGSTPKPEAICLFDNDYLALKKLLKSPFESNDQILMSSVFFDSDAPQIKLEHRLANFLYAEDTLIFQSGLTANMGLVQSIADKNTKVYIDHEAHMSFYDGIKISGAKAIPFRHNSMESLQQAISHYGPGVILVDTIYSLDSSVCPLEKITSIAEETDCIVVADESHALGVFGPNGRGRVVECGLEDKVHFRTASLSKAFAINGGIIACSSDFKEYAKFNAHSLVFSSAIPTSMISVLHTILDIIQDADEKRMKLQENTQYFRKNLSGLGYYLVKGKHIVSLESGTNRNTVILRNALERRDIYGAVFCPPATPKNRSLLRFSLNSGLSREQLDYVLQACENIRDEVGMWNWESTLKK